MLKLAYQRELWDLYGCTVAIGASDVEAAWSWMEERQARVAKSNIVRRGQLAAETIFSIFPQLLLSTALTLGCGWTEI